MMRNKPKAGQIVYSLNIGNAAIRREQKLTPMKVVKVGTKKFYIQRPGAPAGGHTIPILLDSFVEEEKQYCPTCQIYETEQEWENEKEENHLCARIGKYFEYGRNAHKITLPALRTIWGIIEANKMEGKR